MTTGRWVLRLTADPAGDLDAALKDMNGLHSPHAASMAGAHLPGSYAHGTVTWHLAYADGAPPHRQPAVLEVLERHRDTVGLDWQVPLGRPVAQRVLDRPSAMRRTLLMRLDASRGDDIAGWQRDMGTLPAHIPAIGSWSLWDVAQPTDHGSDHPPTGQWTHAVEHWFDSTADFDLSADYMTSPAHITLVDRHFDSDQPGAPLVQAFDTSHYLVPQ